MQEKAERMRHAKRAQFCAERKEMVILNPERGIGLAEPQQRAREERIHFAIRLIIIVRRADQVGTGVQRRPKRRIGEAFVIATVMRRRQIEHRQRTGAQRLNFGKRFLLRAIAHAAAGTHPNRARFLHHGQQGCCQTAGHRLIRRSARYSV
jgi:hypothetical protein